MIIYKAIKGILHITCLFLFRVKKVGEENIEPNTPYVLCGNHRSNWDPVVLVACTKRRICFMAKAELFKVGFFRYLAKLFGIFPVKRGQKDVSSIKTSLKVIHDNEILGIFPEGKRIKITESANAKNGAAFIIARTGAKVIPVGIQGDFKPFRKIILNYGKPLDFSKYQSKKPEKEVLDKISKEIMDQVIELTKQKN